MDQNKIKIDLDSIEEFPPSYKRNNYNNSNQENNKKEDNDNQYKSATLKEKDDFEEFAENFNKNTTIYNQEEYKIKENSSLKEINLENNKQFSFKYNEKEYNFIFLSYTNLNFIILSENKKIGNLYTANVEEPEYQLDQDDDIEMLPPEYEIKCTLGNRFDNLNGFFANYISSNFFNFCQKANKALYENPKFDYNFKHENEFDKNENQHIDIFKGRENFIRNENSFFNKCVRNSTSLLISLDLKIENVCNKKIIENKKYEKLELDTIIHLDEFEIAEMTSEFNSILRDKILDVLN